MKNENTMIDSKKLVNRQKAAKIYGGTVSAIDYHVRKGNLKEVFAQGSCHLFNRDDVVALRRLGLKAGRPKGSKDKKPRKMNPNSFLFGGRKSRNLKRRRKAA